jgi:hypothetical protein
LGKEQSMTISAEYVRAALNYSPETGLFTWKTAGHLRRVGAAAGGKRARGHLEIRVGGKQHKAHRLAWVYVHGVWPPHDIDHINGDKADNRLCNLRLADDQLNAENIRVARSTNKLGVLGVKSHYGKYQARIRVLGRAIHIGTFDTPETAYAAYVEAKRRLHAGCTL